MKKIIAFVITLIFFTQTAFAADIASYYSNSLQGHKTASGERYDKKKLTAAHRTLPFGSLVKVTNVKTGTFVTVLINDRGPSKRSGRSIDLSYASMKAIGGIRAGTLKVTLEVVRRGWGGK